MAKKAAGTRKAAPARSSTRRADGPKGPDIDTSGDVADQRPALTRSQKAAEAKRKHEAKTAHAPIIPPKNPPDQPRMVPAKQVEGATSQALDPEEQPHHRMDPKKAIRVQAKALGYYGDQLRRVGDVFDIAGEEVFSTKWMRRVSDKTPTQLTGSNAALEKAKKGEDPNALPPEPKTGSDLDVLGD